VILFLNNLPFHPQDWVHAREIKEIGENRRKRLGPSMVGVVRGAGRAGQQTDRRDRDRR
jgi:hypothetical protein